MLVTDVNDNAPEVLDPREDVVSAREEQPPGTEVARVRAVDRDNGYNASVTYSVLKGRDLDGYGVFTIDPVTGVIRTRVGKFMDLCNNIMCIIFMAHFSNLGVFVSQFWIMKNEQSIDLP